MVGLIRERLVEKLMLRRQYQNIKQARCFSTGFSFPTPKALDTIVKKDLLENENSSKIESIWQEYHQEKDDCISKSMDQSTHLEFIKRGVESPLFIFPVHREKGMFTMISQFQENYILMTYLEAFKKNATQAPPYLTISLYDDLLESKNISLIRGDIVSELNKKEATQLLDNLISHYIEDTRYDQHVNIFNNQPSAFDFEKYLLQYPTF